MTVRGADLCACLTELKGISKGLTGFSHMYSPDDLNNISLCQGSVLESTLAIGTVDIKCIPRAGEGVRSPNCLNSAMGQLVVMVLNDLLEQNVSELNC